MRFAARARRRGVRELQAVRQSAARARDENLRLAGRGARAAARTIWDQSGKSYLDFAGGYGVFTLGHSHPRVVAAVREQLELMSLSGKTMFNVCSGARPGGWPRSRRAICRFRSGATAEPRRSKARSSSRAPLPAGRRSSAPLDAFHGKTMGALSVSGRETFQTPFQPLLEGFAHVPYGDASMLDAALREAAAFVVEPVQGEGGVNVPPLGYLRAVRAACDRTGALFIADEVQTGLGRCGYRFACDRDGVVPDVMTLAKGLSGGVMPVGAFIARPDVLEPRLRQSAAAAHLDFRRKRTGMRGRTGGDRRAGRRRVWWKARASAANSCSPVRARSLPSSPQSCVKRAGWGCWSAWS